MKAFRALMYGILFSIIFAAVIIAATILSGAAKAAPGEEMSIPAVARHVCEALDADPTVDGINAIIDALFAAGNTEEQENAVMYYAIQITCPEYLPLAEAAYQESIGGIGDKRAI